MEASFTDAIYRGAPTCFAAWYRFLSMGGTDLEVIEPLSGKPSPYRDFLDAGGHGVHHLAFVVDSIDDQLAAVPGAGVLVDARIRLRRDHVLIEVEALSRGAAPDGAHVLRDGVSRPGAAAGGGPSSYRGWFAT